MVSMGKKGLRTFLQNARYKYQNSLLVATTSRAQILPIWLLNWACCQENQILGVFQKFDPLYSLFSYILFYNIQLNIINDLTK